MQVQPDSNSATVANIPSNYSRIIGRELGLQQQQLPQLLRFTGLSSRQFMQEDMLLTTNQQIQVIRNALQLSNLPDFGLRLGKTLTPSTHGLVGFLVNSCPNLLSALEAIQVFLPTRLSFARLQMHIDKEVLSCKISFNLDLQPEVNRVLSETLAVAFYACAEFIVGRPVVEASVCFTHQQPSYSSCYAGYLPGVCVFGAPTLMVNIPLPTCHIANASANHSSYVLAMEQCEKILEQLSSQQVQQHSTTYQIQKLMLSHPLSSLNEEDVAASLFISKRTLARRLEKEGTGFRQIRDTILSQQATSYLKDSDLTVDAIATLLNYHDSANFRRAFKRWFSVSPHEYRCKQMH